MMKNLIMILGCCLCLAAHVSVATQAADKIDIPEKKAPKDAFIASNCPTDFHGIALPKKALQCQRFDAEFPASLVYFSPKSPSELVDYYLKKYPDYTARNSGYKRVLLTKNDGNSRIIVSPDNKGTQIDILLMDEPKP